MIPIPVMAIPNRISAVISSRCVQIRFSLLMDIKESITERQSKAATILANSSKIELVVAELTCNEVITIKQNPSRLEAVGRMC